MLSDALLGFANSTGNKLLWVDSVDVNTMRQLVEFARLTSATIHVGQTTGGEVLAKVQRSEGWMCATLGEIGQRADLVVTLGDSLLHDQPMLANRYLKTTDALQRHWVHLGKNAPEATLNLAVPPDQVLNPLTALLEALQTENPKLVEQTAIAPLFNLIGEATYAAIVFQSSDLLSEFDELTVRRIAQMARSSSESPRITVVALDGKPGRITADETLLWLTGNSETAQWSGNHWTRPAQITPGFQDWRNAFNAIAIVRSVPADEPLPDLAAELVLVPSSEVRYLPPSAEHYFAVADSCIDHPGHLFRGDRAGVYLCGAENERQPTGISTEAPKARANAAAVAFQLANTFLRQNVHLSSQVSGIEV